MEELHQVVDVAVVSFKKRTVKAKSNIRKREPTPPPTSHSDSGFTSSEDEEGRQIKRRRKNVGVIASSTMHTVARAKEHQETSAPVATLTNKDDATKTSNWYDEPKSKSTTEAPSADGTYRGQSSYGSFIQKNPNRDNKVVGPVKTSSNVRTITVTDFAPDVCKDYKQTGFCGFGDSCKFLHVREAYSQGWQLDREWEMSGKGKKPGGKMVASANRHGDAAVDGDDDDKLLESIPFACIICKENYKYPIITKCGHYFCEDPSCAACGAGTGGVFNVAKKLNRLLERKRERQKEREEQGEENDAPA
jgi:RING finger protein 113A